MLVVFSRSTLGKCSVDLTDLQSLIWTWIRIDDSDDVTLKISYPHESSLHLYPAIGLFGRLMTGNTGKYVTAIALQKDFHVYPHKC